MIDNPHSINVLFDQLGLESSDKAVDLFVRTHQLPNNTSLERADFWKPWQVQFFYDARDEDAMWSAPVDDLNVRLHNPKLYRSAQ